MDNQAPVHIKETHIEIGGVLRCCIATVAEEFLPDGQVAAGTKSKCRHCDQAFTLVLRAKSKRLTWTPDWQLKTEP